VRIAGVVFAAGASRRMGRNKMLMELDGEPLVRRAARRALEAGLSPVVVVIGFEQDRIRPALDGLDVLFSENPDYKGPMSESMHAALRALPDDADGVVVVLGDMVHVTAEMIRSVAVGATESDAPLVVSRYGDVTAPPIMFRRALFDELLAWQGEGCGKPVVRDHLHEAGYCDWPVAALWDADTPSDVTTLGIRE
jgi:molybdenum cofactor cytidylyltransferase